MDNRILLKPGTRLLFPGMCCTVQSVIGCGSNAIVYLGSYRDHQLPELEHRVLIKELFPFHPEGKVFREEDGSIRWTKTAEAWMETQRASFQRGNEIHLRLLHEHPEKVEANLNTYSYNNTLYAILGFSGGRSLDDELNHTGTAVIPLAHHVRRILDALDALAVFHEAGFLHLDISPDNILLIGDGRGERVALIDYNSVHTMREIQEGAAVYFSEKEGYTAPELRSRTVSRIGPGSDLYSLAAVFYRCVAGAKLTILETSRATVPDCSDSACLRDFPETVQSMVRCILRRGLAHTPAHRYRSIAEFRRDLEELQDRIDGKGITHWALWEAGKIRAARIVQANPALNYLRDREQLFPILCRDEAGNNTSFDTELRQMTMPGGQSVLLTAGGGAGKTTALLSAALSQEPCYSSSNPAICYMSLYGWNSDTGHSVQDMLLQSLRFKPETKDMESARHELLQLLSSPAHTRWGERPRLLLLLDGLNEASGDIGALILEIRELAALPGLRLCIAGRSDADIPSLKKLALCPLTQEESARYLRQNGFLMPEGAEVQELLTSPLMLSMFVRAAKESGKQPEIRNREDLLGIYFDALAESSVRGQAADTAVWWQFQAAIQFVLPELAQKMHATGGPVSEQTLLPTLERCWRLLGKRVLFAGFPKWIGHISEIRGNAKDAEEWYGIMVHSILWRRMGLLVRNEQGNYRLFHSVIEPELLARRQRYQRIFRRHRLWKAGFLLTAALLLAYPCERWLLPLAREAFVSEPRIKYYSTFQAESVLSYETVALLDAAKENLALQALLTTIQESPESKTAVANDIRSSRKMISNAQLSQPDAALLLAQGLPADGVMPWSGKALDMDAFETLIRFPSEWAVNYGKCLDTLEGLREKPEIWAACGDDYVDKLSQALHSDIYLLQKYKESLLAPEYAGMGESVDDRNKLQYDEAMKLLAGTPPLAMDTLQTYEWIQKTSWSAVLANPARLLLGESVT